MRDINISQRRHSFGPVMCTPLLPLTWETRWLDELRVRLRVGIDNWQVLRSPKLILPLISVFTVGLPSARTRQLGLEAGITHLLVGMRNGQSLFPWHVLIYSRSDCPLSWLILLPHPSHPHTLILFQVLLSLRDLSERGLTLAVSDLLLLFNFWKAT